MFAFYLALIRHFVDQKLSILLYNWATILVIIFWDFLMLHQIFFSPQVKPGVIHSNKHGIYKLLHELLNELRLRINFIELLPSAQLFSKNKSVVHINKTLLKKSTLQNISFLSISKTFLYLKFLYYVHQILN